MPPKKKLKPSNLNSGSAAKKNQTKPERKRTKQQQELKNEELSTDLLNAENPALEKYVKKKPVKKPSYPPRLLVDFKRLDGNALKRYANFYHINVLDSWTQSDLAASVARHFDSSLDVDELDSICSFVRRVRNGELGRFTNTSFHAPDRHNRKDAKKNAKKTGMLSTNVRKRARTGTNSANQPPMSNHPSKIEEVVEDGEDVQLYCICNKPSYGNMIACDGRKCPNPSQWYHLECVGLSIQNHPDTWLCPECSKSDSEQSTSHPKKKLKKSRSKSPIPKK